MEVRRQAHAQPPNPFREEVVRDILTLANSEARWKLFDALYRRAKVDEGASKAQILKWLSEATGINRNQLWKYTAGFKNRQGINPETSLKVVKALTSKKVGGCEDVAAILQPVAERMRTSATDFMDWMVVFGEGKRCGV
jgi:hypothetical protein